MNSANTRRVCLMLALLVLPALAGTSLFADQDDPPGRAARLSVVRGNVSFQPSGEDQWSQATLNYTLTTGDRLYTDQGARAELEVGPFAVRMSEGTDLTIANLNDRTMQLGLGQGSVRASVYEMPPGNTVEIDTPNGALLANGRGTYRIDVDPNYGTRVSVFDGSIEVTGGGADQRVDRGQSVELTGTGPIQINPVDFPGRDGFDRWCDSRDARIRAFASRRYVSAYTPGAEDLDAYGRWETVADYGPVWYPAGVPGGWVPYRYGHWAWIEPWGWTWVEDEPWGFCPFHYGRWAFIGTSWGWVPGPVVVAPVYAPAFVAFVGGPSFSIGIQFGGGLGIAAWFPLGPSEPFIPWYHYSGVYLRQVNVTNVRNVTNITNITNITNVNNIHYENRTVATTAVPAETFRSGQPVARQVIHVAPQQLAQAQVVAHPNVAPVKTAAFGGHPPAPTPPVRTPPVRATRMTAPFQGARAGQPSGAPPARGTPPTAAAPEGRPSSTPPPVITRSSPPARTEPSQPAPSFNRGTPPPRTQPGQPAPSDGGFKPFGGNRPVTPPPSTPPPVITRTPPPPRDVPFSAHEPAYQQHPGRPLEPQQEQNLRVGRPPGPMRDREVAPHAPPPPAPRAAPSRTPTKTESRPEPPKQKERR